MDDHRTLDEYLGDRTAGDDGRDEDRKIDASGDGEDSKIDESGDRGGTEIDVEPPRTTYRWTPEGVACPECGTIVERRWRDGEVFVCPDCKQW
ncbi:MAG: DUF7573 domain-containing protein [Halolamina sp.]